MLNFIKNLTGKTDTPKAEKPAGESCGTEQSATGKKDEKSGGCCGGHCH